MEGLSHDNAVMAALEPMEEMGREGRHDSLPPHCDLPGDEKPLSLSRQPPAMEHAYGKIPQPNAIILGKNLRASALGI